MPGFALSRLVLQYVLTLVMVYVVGLIIDALAPTFGGTKDKVQALKTITYSITASCVAGIALILPLLGTLIALAALVYNIYLLYLGLPHTMKCPPERAGSYTAVIVIVALVAGLLIGTVVGAVTGTGMFMRGGSMFSSTRDSHETKYDKDSTVGKLEQYAKQVEDASKKMEAAQKSGDQQAQADAMKNMMGAALGSGNVEAVTPDRLEAVSAGDARRPRSLDVFHSAQQRDGHADDRGAGHVHGRRRPPMGSASHRHRSAKGLLALAGWAGIEGENESSNGYDKTYRADGRLVHEQWDRGSSRGEYAMVLGDRFTVKIEGQADSIDDLKAALADLDLEALEAMKGEGVAKN
jgi:hypothetical protein